MPPGCEPSIGWRLASPGLSGLERAKAAKLVGELASKVTLRSVAGNWFAEGWLDAKVGEIKVLLGHTGAVNSLAVYRSGHGVISGSSDQTVRIWDLTTGRQVRQFPAGGGRRVDRRSVVRRAGCDRRGEPHLDRDLEFRRPAASRDQDRLLRCGIWLCPRMVNVCSGPNQRRIRRTSCFPISPRACRSSKWNCPSTPNCLALSASGRLAAVANDRRVLVVSDFGRGTATLTGHRQPAVDVQFSPDERTVASCAADEIILWDLATGKERRRLLPISPCNCLDFSPDGSRLVSAGTSGELMVWEVRSGTLLETLRGSGGADGAILDVAVLPDAWEPCRGEPTGASACGACRTSAFHWALRRPSNAGRDNFPVCRFAPHPALSPYRARELFRGDATGGTGRETHPTQEIAGRSAGRLS